MKYIASWSGGKDSTASIILAHEHGEPLDEIIFSEVMFDKNISGELPEHIDFIKNKATPMFENWGYKVTVLHADRTYLDCFNMVTKRSKLPERNGKRRGFPLVGHCCIGKLKVGPIKEYNKSQSDICIYIGIASDELKRLERLKANQISLLAKYGYTEKETLELCKRYGLLSPIYKIYKRSGCWFCPNARDTQLRYLRTAHKELWNKLLELEDETNCIGDIWNTLTRTSIHDKEVQFKNEEQLQ